MDRTTKLTANFALHEFIRPQDETPPKEILENLKRLAIALEEVRKILGNKPMYITSGYRTPAHNKAVGGAPRSDHIRGLAADIIVDGMTPKQVQNKLKDWWGGMGCYKTFSHLDIGPKRRWNY